MILLSGGIFITQLSRLYKAHTCVSQKTTTPLRRLRPTSADFLPKLTVHTTHHRFWHRLPALNSILHLRKSASTTNGIAVRRPRQALYVHPTRTSKQPYCLSRTSPLQIRRLRRTARPPSPGLGARQVARHALGAGRRRREPGSCPGCQFDSGCRLDWSADALWRWSIQRLAVAARERERERVTGDGESSGDELTAVGSTPLAAARGTGIGGFLTVHGGFCLTDLQVAYA